MNKHLAVSLVLGAAISAGAFYLAFQQVSFSALRQYLSGVNVLWIVPGIMLSQFTFVLRAMRWRLLLSAAGKVGFWESFHPLMIGFMVNCVAPGRIGEAVRPIVLSKTSGISISAGFAAVIAERLLDLLFLLLLLMIALQTVEIDPDLKISFGSYQLDRETLMRLAGGMTKLAAALIVGCALLLPDKIRSRIKQLVLMSPRWLLFLSAARQQTVTQKIGVPLVIMIDNFAAGLSLIRYPAKFGICLIYSWLIWTLQIAAYYLVMLGCPGIGLTLIQMTVYLVIICIFIILPSVPGFWGLWEAGGVFALALFGVNATEAAGFTLTNHAVQVFPVILVGFVSMAAVGVTFNQVKKSGLA